MWQLCALSQNSGVIHCALKWSRLVMYIRHCLASSFCEVDADSIHDSLIQTFHFGKKTPNPKPCQWFGLIWLYISEGRRCLLPVKRKLQNQMRVRNAFLGGTDLAAPKWWPQPLLGESCFSLSECPGLTTSCANKFCEFTTHKNVVLYVLNERHGRKIFSLR